MEVRSNEREEQQKVGKAKRKKNKNVFKSKRHNKHSHRGPDIPPFTDRDNPPAVKDSSCELTATDWNFAVDYNDHFETPKIAYEDISPVLRYYAMSLQKSATKVKNNETKELCSENKLRIYDPYWCQGTMVAHLRELGFHHVINNNRDFYRDIATKRVPEYDILVTNPPYSGEHKVRLLEYLLDSSKPFALLLPVYVATKAYWKQFCEKLKLQAAPTQLPITGTTGTTGTTSTTGCNDSSGNTVQRVRRSREFYILPPDYYEYSHPENTGKDVPPFYSAWFLGGFPIASGTATSRGIEEDDDRAKIIELLRKHHTRQTGTTASPTGGGDRGRAIRSSKTSTSGASSHNQGPTTAAPPSQQLPHLHPQLQLQPQSQPKSPLQSQPMLQFERLVVAESVDALVSRGVVAAEKRPNPKQRRKKKKLLQQQQQR